MFHVTYYQLYDIFDVGVIESMRLFDCKSNNLMVKKTINIGKKK